METSLSPVLAGPVALMPDAHLGKGATVGSVIVTEGAILPAAVGVDIGCGMIAALTNRRLKDLEHPQQILRDIRRGVPAGFDWHKAADPTARRWLEENPIPHVKTLSRATNAIGRMGKQLGTLGGGNHFVEISSDELNRLWIVLHTGSRGIGNQIATHHIASSARVCARKGRRATRDLAYYLSDDDLFDVYISQMLWAQSYALEKSGTDPGRGLGSFEKSYGERRTAGDDQLPSQLRRSGETWRPHGVGDEKGRYQGRLR